VWIYHWGQGWTLDARERTLIEPGTPVLIVGQYGFGEPAPWRSLDHLARGIALPSDFRSGSERLSLPSPPDIRAGARGYVMKQEPIDGLVGAIRCSTFPEPGRVSLPGRRGRRGGT
jgi:hypothetical protein